MRLEDVLRYSVRENLNIYNSVNRAEFTCLEIDIPTNSNFMRKTYAYAQEIFPRLNIGQANSSEDRALSVVEVDNLSGLIAEMACKEIMDWRYGKEKILKPESRSSYNQIDLKLYNDRTIEVRSSCVRNGIDFALFAKNKKPDEEQYFDVIGPYTNGYKEAEGYKDYYMRVLYECDKMHFMELLHRPTLRMYITGGATKAMMCDPDIYQIKHLTPAGGQVQEESDYRVVPLAKSLDIHQFFDVLEEQNTALKQIGKM